MHRDHDPRALAHGARNGRVGDTPPLRPQKDSTEGSGGPIGNGGAPKKYHWEGTLKSLHGDRRLCHERGTRGRLGGTGGSVQERTVHATLRLCGHQLSSQVALTRSDDAAVWVRQSLDRSVRPLAKQSNCVWGRTTRFYRVSNCTELRSEFRCAAPVNAECDSGLHEGKRFVEIFVSF